MFPPVMLTSASWDELASMHFHVFGEMKNSAAHASDHKNMQSHTNVSNSTVDGENGHQERLETEIGLFMKIKLINCQDPRLEM